MTAAGVGPHDVMHRCLNDSERAAKIAKISKTAKSQERAIKAKYTEELAEIWVWLFAPLLGIQTTSLGADEHSLLWK